MKKTFKRLSALLATAAMAVSCGTMSLSAEETSAVINLSDSVAVAGKYVTVDLTLESGNRCAGYNLDIEFDSELKLERIEGVVTSCVVDNVVTLVNFTGTHFQDGKVMSTLTFEVPQNAEEGTVYDVRVSRIGNLCNGNIGEFDNVEINDSAITVLEAAKPVTRHMVYIEEKGNTNAEVALRGDVNGDGNVDLYDAIMVTKKMMSMENLNKKQEFFANVNEDQSTDLYDAISICRYNMSADKENAWGEIISK